MQFNQFNLYSMNAGGFNTAQTDFVDSCMQELRTMNEYDEVKNYLTDKFGELDGEKWLEYPELKKSVYIVVDNEKVEFCALKNERQYFGKGWKLIK